MEDLFDIILVIAVAVIAAVSKSNKNKKKKAADKPAQAAEPVQPAAKPIASVSDRKMINRRNIESAVKAFSELAESMDKAKTAAQSAPAKKAQTVIEAETAAKQRAEIISARVQESLSGQSPVDDHGCIGGSMPDHEAEGETLAEHAGHERERQQRIAEETALRAEDLHKPTARDLRRAVIMSEILDKPLAFRGRRV